MFIRTCELGSPNTGASAYHFGFLRSLLGSAGGLSVLLLLLQQLFLGFREFASYSAFFLLLLLRFLHERRCHSLCLTERATYPLFRGAIHAFSFLGIRRHVALLRLLLIGRFNAQRQRSDSRLFAFLAYLPPPLWFLQFSFASSSWVCLVVFPECPGN